MKAQAPMFNTKHSCSMSSPVAADFEPGEPLDLESNSQCSSLWTPTLASSEYCCIFERKSYSCLLICGIYCFHERFGHRCFVDEKGVLLRTAGGITSAGWNMNSVLLPSSCPRVDETLLIFEEQAASYCSSF